jgi:predicted transcriptional regulator
MITITFQVETLTRARNKLYFTRKKPINQETINHSSGLKDAVYILKCISEGHAKSGILWNNFDGDLRLISMWISFLENDGYLEENNLSELAVTDKGKRLIQKHYIITSTTTESLKLKESNYMKCQDKLTEYGCLHQCRTCGILYSCGDENCGIPFLYGKCSLCN